MYVWTPIAGYRLACHCALCDQSGEERRATESEEGGVYMDLHCDCDATIPILLCGADYDTYSKRKNTQRV